MNSHLLFTFYADLDFPVGIPQVYYFGQEGLHNILVIDLLGPSLEDLFDMCGRKFTVKTCCMTAKQMVCQGFMLVGGLCCISRRCIIETGSLG